MFTVAILACYIIRLGNSQGEEGGGVAVIHYIGKLIGKCLS